MNGFVFYADGGWLKPTPSEEQDSKNPTTGEVWAQIPKCRSVDVDKAFHAAHRAFQHYSRGSMRPSKRGRALPRGGDTLIEKADRLDEIESRDNGKKSADITPGLHSWLAGSFYNFAGLADNIESTIIPDDAPGILNDSRCERFGAVAFMTAWNSPLLIVIRKPRRYRRPETPWRSSGPYMGQPQRGP